MVIHKVYMWKEGKEFIEVLHLYKPSQIYRYFKQDLDHHRCLLRLPRHSVVSSVSAEVPTLLL
ncbi:hypothetical protein PILCRDRAFT_819366, partial [Piloderma croceum F 1598]